MDLLNTNAKDLKEEKIILDKVTDLFKTLCVTKYALLHLPHPRRLYPSTQSRRHRKPPTPRHRNRRNTQTSFPKNSARK